MRRDLVTRVSDPPDDSRVLISNPSQHEKRRTDVVPGKQREKGVDIPLDATRQGRPLRSPDDPLEGVNLEVFFHVHAEDVLCSS
jgi:hypothetical protein